ncbi:MAG: hypothetical protein WBX14_08565 [Candidatus Udaeobacter sp.]
MFAWFALTPVGHALSPPKPEDRGNFNSTAENVSEGPATLRTASVSNPKKP